MAVVDRPPPPDLGGGVINRNECLHSEQIDTGRMTFPTCDSGADVKIPLVTEIQRFSLQDGPGFRTTVFLKGCPIEMSVVPQP